MFFRWLNIQLSNIRWRLYINEQLVCNWFRWRFGTRTLQWNLNQNCQQNDPTCSGPLFTKQTLSYTMDLEAHSYEVHMKPYIHNFTWNLFLLHKNLLWTSYELHMKFTWTSHEFHMKWHKIYSYEIHEKLIWTSYGVQMNFSWNSYEIKSNLFKWIYMPFVWSSNELYIEELMMLICCTHVIKMKLTWGS